MVEVSCSFGVYITGAFGKKAKATCIFDDQTGMQLLEIASSMSSGFPWAKKVGRGVGREIPREDWFTSPGVPSRSLLTNNHMVCFSSEQDMKICKGNYRGYFSHKRRIKRLTNH